MNKTILIDMVLILLLIVAFYYPIFFQGKSLFPFAGGEVTRNWPELQNFYTHNQLTDKGASDWIEIPLISSLRNLISHKEIPIWNPNNGLGIPIVPSSNGPVFFPLEWINVLFQGELSWSLFYLLRIFFGAAFLYLLLRDLNLSRISRFAGILILIFNGYVGNFLNIFYLNVDMMIPALLYYFSQMAQSPRRKNIIFSALAFGIAILGGNPQPLLIGLFFCASFYFLRYFQKENFSLINLWLSIKPIFLALAGGTLLASFFIFPFIELYRVSLTLREFYGSLTGNPASLINLTSSSYYFWGIKKYGNDLPWIGINAILLIIASAFIKFKQKNRVILIFLWSFLLLFFAKYFGLWPLHLIKDLPIIREITFIRYTFVLYLIFSILIAYIVENIGYIKNNLKRVFLIVLGLLLLLLVYLYFDFLAKGMEISNFDFYFKQAQENQLYLIIFSIFLILISIFWIKNIKLAQVLIFLAIAMELFIYIPNDAWPIRNHNAFRQSNYITFLKNDNKDKERIYGFGSLMMPNQSSYYDMNDLRSLTPLKPQRYWDFMNRFILKNDNFYYGFGAAKYFYSESIPFLQLANVRYIISEDYIGKIKTDKISECESLYGTLCSLHPNAKENKIFYNDSFSIKTLEIKNSQNQFIFYVSMPEENWSPEKGDGVLIKVFNDNEKGEILAEKYYDPKNNAQDRKKIQVDIDLNKFNGQQIDLFFKVYPGNSLAFDSINLDGFSLEPKLSDLELIYNHDVKIYKLQNTCPKYFLVPDDHVIYANNMEDSFNKLEDASKKYPSLCNVSVIEKDGENSQSSLADSPAADNITTIRDLSWKKEFLVNADSDQFMIISNLYYPGWIAYIDDKKTALYAADGVIQSIEIPRGNHHIEIIYRPFSLIIGIIVSLLTTIFLIFFSLLNRKRASHLLESKK